MVLARGGLDEATSRGIFQQVAAAVVRHGVVAPANNRLRCRWHTHSHAAPAGDPRGASARACSLGLGAYHNPPRLRHLTLLFIRDRPRPASCDSLLSAIL